ncbi:MAG: sulfatase [Polyangia bacterium]
MAEHEKTTGRTTVSPSRATLLAVCQLAVLALGACGDDRPREKEIEKERAAAAEAEQVEPDAADDGGTRAASPEPAEPQAPEGRRVVLIVIDTLRADRLGCYGYEEQEVTPAIDRLAEEGVLFEKFHSASPWTGASFASILTGVAPTVHRAGKRLPSKSKEGESFLGVRVTPIGKKVATLPELLGETTSAAIVTNAFLHPSLGFARGFNHYDHEVAGLYKARRADEVTDAAIEWLRGHEDDSFFLMVHYFDPHISYDPPPEYRKRFAKPPSGRIGVPFADHAAARSGELDPSENEERFIRGLYNGEVRFVDDQIGRMLEEMDGLGMLDDSWIALTADHGEEQFDHGSFDHGHRYEDEVTRVPLVIRAPGGKWKAGERVGWSARHVDIAPTVLDWLGVEPHPQFSGESLMPLISGEEEQHRPAYMECNIYWKARRALFDGRYKLIRDVEGERGYMYDLDEDPGEQNRFGKDHPRYAELEERLSVLVTALEKRARELRTGDAGQEAVELSEDVSGALRALGYLEENEQ